MPTPWSPSHGYARVLPLRPGDATPFDMPAAPDVARRLRLPSGNHNVPAPLNSFVGRERDVALAGRQLKMSRLVTLVGPPGVGKTRLAIEVATEVLPNYPDGVWLVELSSITDPAMIPEALASMLDIRERPGFELGETLVAELRDCRSLIVLDNCEHLIEGSAHFAERLLRSCGEVVVLATSRESLGLAGEAILRVEPLAVPSPQNESYWSIAAHDGVRLFVERATAIEGGFALHGDSARDVAEVCRRLDGIPLAIEFAAARLESLSLAEIVQHLDERLRLLSGRTSASPSHHRTLRTTLDWSHELLTMPEAVVFRRLSIFSGGCTLEAAKAVGAGGLVERESVMELVAGLVKKSLVFADTSRTDTRYRLLDTVRDYGFGKLVEADEQAATRRAHCDWLVALAEQAEPELAGETDAGWQDRLAAERDNFRSALEWAIADRRTGPALRLSGALVLFWWLQGHISEGRRWIGATLSAGAGEPPLLRAKALWGAGLLTGAAGEISEAIQLAEQSLAMSSDCGSSNLPGRARSLLGLLALYRGPLHALPQLESHVAMARREGDGLLLSSALANLGSAYVLLGDAASARACLNECLELTDRLGRNRYEGVLNGLGQVALLQGDYQAAGDLFNESLEVSRRLNEPEGIAGTLSWQGELARRKGDYRHARELLDEGLDLAREHGAPFSVARCLCFRARVAQAEGNIAAARALFEESLSIARRVGLTYLVARCLIGMGEISLAQGELSEAAAHLEEALAIAEANGDRPGVAATWHAMAELARVRGPLEDANTLCHEALRVQQEVGDVPGIAASLELLAQLRGDGTSAVRLLGAGQNLRASGGYARPPGATLAIESVLESVRDAVGPDEFALAWSEGFGLSLETAVKYAMRGRGARRRSAVGLASLTPTQLQVARLAAEGLTNREIGERLFVSPRTAGSHLARIFTKLGVSSRRELAAHLERPPAV